MKPNNFTSVIEDAERQGLLYPNSGSCIFEGTVGSTGISIATMARAKYVENIGLARNRTWDHL